MKAEKPLAATPVEAIVSISSLIGELRQFSHNLTTKGSDSVEGKHPELLQHAARKLETMADVLKQFSECDLNDRNCASLEVATARIRNLARRGLR